MLFDAYSRSHPSAPSPMSLAHEAALMILLPLTSYRLSKFISAYVPLSPPFGNFSQGRLTASRTRVCFSTSIAISSGSTRKLFKKNAATAVRNRTGTGPYHGRTRENPPSSMVPQPPSAATVKLFLTVSSMLPPSESPSQFPREPAAAVSPRVLFPT